MEYLQDKEIINEYGETITLEEFKQLVEDKQGGKNHHEECKNNPYDRSYLDDEGYSMDESEFC